MKLLICFALKEEAAPFRKLATAQAVSILTTGIGRQNAEKSVRDFLNSRGSRSDETRIDNQSKTPHGVSPEPSLVLACGFAGGLNPDLKIGDVVFELGNFEIRNPQSAIRDALRAAGAKPVKFFCADRIATTVAEKKKLRDETGADAVEMESAAIQGVCAERGIPCATIRVISDTANKNLPLDFNEVSKPDKSLDFGKLILAIGKSPGKIGPLMELRRNAKFAAKRLAEVLNQIIR